MIMDGAGYGDNLTRGSNDKLAALLDPTRWVAMLAEGVRPGQLWLAEPYEPEGISGGAESDDQEHDPYPDSAEFVLITAIDEADPRLVHVIPMSNDPSIQTERSVVVADSPMGMPMVAWKQLAVAIPMRFLSRPLGSFDEATTKHLAKGEPDKRLGITCGEKPLSRIGRENREFMFRAIRFAAWQAACSKLPKFEQEDEQQEALARQQREAYMHALRTVLGMQAADRARVVRGVKKLTAAQHKKMAKAGFPEPPADALPMQYQVMAEQPMWRPLVEKIDRPEDETRAELSRDAFKLAARATGPRDSAIQARFEQVAKAMLSHNG